MVLSIYEPLEVAIDLYLDGRSDNTARQDAEPHLGITTNSSDSDTANAPGQHSEPDGAGGGGGYSGGGGSSSNCSGAGSWGNGGGGGSYNNGSNQDNASNVNSVHGQVTISLAN